jgi:hypothetical protein
MRAGSLEKQGEQGISKSNRLMNDFTLHYKTGAIINQLTAERDQVVPALRWNKLEEALTSEFQEKSTRIMSLIGSTVVS